MSDLVWMANSAVTSAVTQVPADAFTSYWSLHGWTQVDPPGGLPGSGLAPMLDLAAWLKEHASNLEALIVGSITRDGNGAATSAGVVWPDGTSGTYTATTVSTAFPGAVDAYTVTYAGGTTRTVAQPAVTRDSTTGAVTSRPAMTVA